MYYFLPDDFEELNKQIEEIKFRIERALEEKGQSIKEGGGGNTWHDNFAFEDAQRQTAMWSARLRELLEIKRNSFIITPDKITTTEVGIGNIVTIRDEETGEINTFQIRGFMVELADDAISYHAPLTQIIVGASVGEKRTGEIGGKKKTFKILEIKK